MAVGESVGAEDVGHAVHGGAVSFMTRRLLVTITGITRPPGADMSPDDVAHARSHQSLVTSLVCAPWSQMLDVELLPLRVRFCHPHPPFCQTFSFTFTRKTQLSFPDKSHVSQEMTGIAVNVMVWCDTESWRLQVTRPGGCCHSVTVCHLPPHTLPELPAVQNCTLYSSNCS